MNMAKSNKVFIALYIIAIAMILASIITLCVYCNYAIGVNTDKVQVSIDGEIYGGRAEVASNTFHELTVDANGADYYICIDSQYGYVSDNKAVYINDGLKDMTLVPIRIILVKENFALSEYVCNLLICNTPM